MPVSGTPFWSVPPPVALKPDVRGGVIVDGDHPDRVLIESLFF